MTTETGLDSQQKFEEILPTVSYFKRMRDIAGTYFSVKALNYLGRVPGLGGLKKVANKPRLMPFTSDAPMMHKWYAKEYGTADKPHTLKDIPWDYVEEYQEEVPFFGLRNFWYPAATADELPHNESLAVKMLGDSIVLFRGENGEIGALENRCPHRNPMLTLGQTNVVEIGTITCRYHGATFNKDGDCVAFLGDGPNSSMCGNAKMKAKSYPAQEINGIIFVWMGDGEPEDIMENIPRAKDALADGHQFSFHKEVPYSHLNILDNAADMTHVGVLHRTCFLFGDQKIGGGVSYEELDRGLKVKVADQGGHAGDHHIDEIDWYLPNMVFHGREFMDGKLNGLLFWWVPVDAGSYKAWMVGSGDRNRISAKGSQKIASRLGAALESGLMPGLACFVGGDAPIQLSQGRIARWDKENLVRGDRGVVRSRQLMKDHHKQEVAERKAKGLDGLVHRVERPLTAEQVIKTPSN